MSKNIVSVENLNKQFSDKAICTDVTFGIEDDDKIGLLGINGCGKSTLLKMLVDKEPVDSGMITLRSDLTIGYLPQIAEFDGSLTIYEQIYYSDLPAFKLLRRFHENQIKLERKYSPKLETNQQELITKIDSCQGWQYEFKAKSILTKLGFSDLNLPTAILSGGQKRRLDLARVLIDEPQFLILDEPTNHLDIETIEWFQEYLATYRGAVIFVTHDRYFLDVVCRKIFELEDGILRQYQGNYSDYLKKKELQLADLQRKETRRATQLRKELKWLHRGAQARTTKPKDHLDRVKELIDKSYLTATKELEISFQQKRLGKSILELKGIGKSYDENTLFNNFNYNFQKLDRIGIIGPNGCGKTTLLKLITGEDEPSSGKIKAGLNTFFSFFRQEIGDFQRDMSVLDYIREQADNIRMADGALYSATEMLEKMLFPPKMQQNRIKSLSGGEKKRLYLLRSLMFGSNFIILDEPTNDLDIKTLEILEDYLDVFKGCVLVVSHDRFFLDRVVDYLFIFEPSGIRIFPGNYSDYLLVKRFRETESQTERSAVKQITDKTKVSNRPVKLSYKEKRELEQLAISIEELEFEKIGLEQQIEKEAGKLSADAFRKISLRLSAIDEQLDMLIERWLTLEEKKG